MLKEFEERITDAKNKQFRMLERFHIGDAVYPFWLKGIIVYGIVTDVDTVARKVFCDFNGVRRQFCPEDLMHVNPEIVNASTLKRRNASADGSYSKFDETHLSDDTDNGIEATCKKCGGEIAVSYDEKTAVADFVCTKCGHRIPDNKLSKETKKAMRENQAKNLKVAGSYTDSVCEDYIKMLDDLDLDDTHYDYYREALEALHEGSSNPNDTHGYKSMDDVLKDAENFANGDYYDDGHAKEWMEKHPYGWYNSENDYGTGDEDDRFASRKAIAQELARVAKSLMSRESREFVAASDWKEVEYQCLVKDKNGYDVHATCKFKCHYGDSVEAVLVSIKDEKGKSIDLTESERERIEGECSWNEYKREYGSLCDIRIRDDGKKVASELLRIASILAR